MEPRIPMRHSSVGRRQSGFYDGAVGGLQCTSTERRHTFSIFWVIFFPFLPLSLTSFPVFYLTSACSTLSSPSLLYTTLPYSTLLYFYPLPSLPLPTLLSPSPLCFLPLFYLLLFSLLYTFTFLPSFPPIILCSPHVSALIYSSRSFQTPLKCYSIPVYCR